MKKKGLLLTGFVVGMLLVGCSSGTDGASEKDSNLVNEQLDVAESKENFEYEYKADITHNGVDETVKVIVEYSDEDSIPTIKVQVNNSNESIYEEEMLLNYALGSQTYLISYEGAYYLMQYTPLVDHDVASLKYEIYSLDEEGNKATFDVDEIELSLFDIEKLDKEEWISFAEQENKYFENAYLLVSTSEGVLEYSTPENKKTYTEQFTWLINGEVSESIEDNLDKFVEETKAAYGETQE